MMNARTVLGLVIWSVASTSLAAEVLERVTWNDVPGAPEGVSIHIVAESTDGVARCLKITKNTAGETTVPLLELETPGVNLPVYGIKGQVRTESVQGKGYLEMLSHFDADQVHFSRTLSGAGPMGHLEGTFDWREFTLPFRNSPGHSPPQRLTMNLVMPGPGTVWIGPVELSQASHEVGLQDSPGQWWHSRQAGLLGGLGGALFGLLGAIVGVLAAKGKAPRFTLGLTCGVIVTGVGFLMLGVIALIGGQPYAVYFPPLLLGGIMAVVCGSNLPVLRRRYRDLELRKMQSQNA